MDIIHSNKKTFYQKSIQNMLFPNNISLIDMIDSINSKFLYDESKHYVSGDICFINLDNPLWFKCKYNTSGSFDHKKWLSANIFDIIDRFIELLGDAPEALDTLKELSEALGNDENFSTTILNKLSKKADAIHEHKSFGVSSFDYSYGAEIIGNKTDGFIMNLFNSSNEIGLLSKVEIGLDDIVISTSDSTGNPNDRNSITFDSYGNVSGNFLDSSINKDSNKLVTSSTVYDFICNNPNLTLTISKVINSTISNEIILDDSGLKLWKHNNDMVGGIGIGNTSIIGYSDYGDSYNGNNYPTCNDGNNPSSYPSIKGFYNIMGYNIEGEVIKTNLLKVGNLTLDSESFENLRDGLNNLESLSSVFFKKTGDKIIGVDGDFIEFMPSMIRGDTNSELYGFYSIKSSKALFNELKSEEILIKTNPDVYENINNIFSLKTHNHTYKELELSTSDGSTEYGENYNTYRMTIKPNHIDIYRFHSTNDENEDDESQIYIDSGSITIKNLTSDIETVIRPNSVTSMDFNGNASSATKLKTERKVGNIAFDGTKDISFNEIMGNDGISSGIPYVASTKPTSMISGSICVVPE